MVEYCNSRELEKLWFTWAMAATVPSLERFRYVGGVYSKIDDSIIRTHGEISRNNPWLSLKEHYILAKPRFTVTSVDGVVNIGLPNPDELIIIPADPDLENELFSKGFIKDIPYKTSWDLLCIEVQKICEGISRKFSSDEDIRLEIQQEALTAVINKIKDFKLKFIPGKAPVFNFLTTAIYRCIFNHLRKDKRYTQQLQHLQDLMAKGSIDITMRSFKTVIGDHNERSTK